MPGGRHSAGGAPPGRLRGSAPARRRRRFVSRTPSPASLPGSIEPHTVRDGFQLPDCYGAYKASGGWRYARAAFLVGEMKWDDLLADQYKLSGSATRWGINLSSNVKVANDTLRLQYV